ncbi:MAG: AMP-binding protein [Oligoflexia bacterium]|nr:AMP-binding protein [Oligoflexia bacterium]
MRIIGPDPVAPATLDADIARTRDLLAQAAVGPLVLATQATGAFARACLAALSTGRPVLPLDPQATAREVAPLLDRAAVLLLDPDVAQRWAVPAGIPTHLVDPTARPSAWQRLVGRQRHIDAFPGCLADRSPAAPAAVCADQLALLLQTSGTTGPSRLVRWTHGALRAQLHTLADALRLGGSDRMLNLLPTHHIDGLVMGPLLIDHVGGTLIRVGPRVVRALPTLLDTVWQERATHLVATPALLALLLRVGEDLREVFGGRDFRMFVSTAAPLYESIWRRVEDATGKPVVNVYGLTETGNLSFAGPDDGSRQRDSVGRARDCELLFVDEQGQPLPTGQVGELWLRGPSVMASYDDDSSPLVDGWYPTGDMARLGADGLLRITGRRKSMLSVGGLKVDPGEVTAALLDHPDVADARVFGEVDAVFGQRVVAEIVPVSTDRLNAGAALDTAALDTAVLTSWLRSSLSEYKLPRRIDVVDAIGRGATGKTPLSPALSLEDRLLALAARVLRAPVDQLSLATRAGDVPGWDSLGHLDLLEAIEQDFHFELTPRQLLGLQSLADALGLIELHCDETPTHG